VAWASPDGLAYVGAGGARLLTAGVMTRVEWQAIHPETITGMVFEGRYYGTYVVASVTKMFMVDPNNPNGIYFMDFGVDAAYVDVLQDAMYVLQGTTIKKWNSGTAMTTTFKSKAYLLPRPAQTFACAQVLADSYAGAVTFKLYADDVLVHTETVGSRDPFRLPAGFLAQKFHVEVATSVPIQAVYVANSVRELAQL